MPRRNLQFDRDALPKSERENPSASSQFDWAGVFAECDRELTEACEDLEPSERRQLAEAVSRILRWVYAVGPIPKARRMDTAIGRRAIALGLHLCPDAMPVEGQGANARALRLSKQAMAKAVKRAKQAFPATPQTNRQK